MKINQKMINILDKKINDFNVGDNFKIILSIDDNKYLYHNFLL